MVEARVRRLPGYVERVELTRQKGPAYRLRQYASRVLGDMQLPDEVLRTARLWALSLDLKDYSVVMLLRHTNAIMAASPQLPDEVLRTVGKKRQDHICLRQCNGNLSITPGSPGLRTASLRAHTLDMKH